MSEEKLGSPCLKFSKPGWMEYSIWKGRSSYRHVTYIAPSAVESLLSPLALSSFGSYHLSYFL